MLLKAKLAKGVFKRLEKMSLQWECDERTAEYHVDYSNEIELNGLFPTSVHLHALRNRKNGKMFALVLVRRGIGRIIPISEFYYDNSNGRTIGIDINKIYYRMLRGTDYLNIGFYN